MKKELMRDRVMVAISTNENKHETNIGISGDGIEAVQSLADSIGGDIVQADVYCLGLAGYSLFMYDSKVALCGSTNTLEGGVSVTQEDIELSEFLGISYAFEPLPIARDVLSIVFGAKYQR